MTNTNLRERTLENPRWWLMLIPNICVGVVLLIISIPYAVLSAIRLASTMLANAVDPNRLPNTMERANKWVFAKMPPYRDVRAEAAYRRRLVGLRGLGTTMAEGESNDD